MFSADVLIVFYMYIGGLQMLCDDDDDAYGFDNVLTDSCVLYSYI